jgi:hypothetical protein
VRDVAAQFGSRSPRRVSITTVGLRPTDPIGQQTGQDVDCAEWVKFFELAWDAPGSEFHLAACALRDVSCRRRVREGMVDGLPASDPTPAAPARKSGGDGA